MELKITKNFSFKKLQSKTWEILDEVSSAYATKSEQDSKQKIDRGLRKLSPLTKEIRKKRGQRPTPALKASGALYKSIKTNKDSLEMLSYGKLHHDGFTTDKKSMIPNIKIEARPFISVTIKNKKEIQKNFIKSIEKALKK